MTDNRPICVGCSIEAKMVIRYHPERNGVVVPYGAFGARHGDLYKCPKCGGGIVIEFGTPETDPEIKRIMLVSSSRILKGVKDK